MDKRLEEILEQLEKISMQDQFAILKTYGVDELEGLAIGLYNKMIYEHHSRLLKDILYSRRQKLNQDFVWTEENKKKLLHLNDVIIRVFNKAYNEALSVSHELEKRIMENDPFLKDYEIEVILTPYIEESNVDDLDTIGRLLSEYDNSIKWHLSYPSKNDNTENTPIYLEKSETWNQWEYLGNNFDGVNLCYAFMDLISNDNWSSKDIINIGRVYADVKVYRQHYEDISWPTPTF
jgi:hypothetical protein